MSLPCKTAALRFLKIRPRSCEEIRKKLKDKGFESKDINDTIDDLSSKKFLDDRVFADAWIRYRLARPFGFGRIIRELKEKGVADNLIQNAVAKARGEYAEDEVILDLAKRRAARLMHLDPQKKKKRIFDYLIRRGFKVDEVMKVIKNANYE